MIDILELDTKVNNHSITDKEIRNVVSDIVSLRYEDPILASKFIPVIAKYYLFTHDNNAVKSILYLCDGYNLDNCDIVIKRYVLYSYFLTYYTLPFYPKAIEYGLALQQAGFNYEFMEINTYNFMSIMCMSIKQHSRFIEYNKQSLNSAKKLFGPDSEFTKIFQIAYYNNSLWVSTLSKNQFAASIARERGLECIKNISDPKLKKVFENYFTLSSLYYLSVFNSENVVDEYLEFIENSKDPSVYIANLYYLYDYHLPFLKLLVEHGKKKEALDVAFYLVNSSNFYGEKEPVFLFIFNNVDLNMFDKNNSGFKNSYSKYCTLLNEHSQDTQEIAKIISNEIFRINEQSKQMQQQSDLYLRDELTRLLNRHSLFSDWERKYSNLDSCTIVFMDLDNLKIVNDSMGHEAGDEYILKFVHMVNKELSSDDAFYRYGGDEFIIISETSREELHRNLMKISYSSFSSDSPSFSFGMATYPYDSTNIRELIKKADEEMYQFKTLRKEEKIL